MSQSRRFMSVLAGVVVAFVGLASGAAIAGAAAQAPAAAPRKTVPDVTPTATTSAGYGRRVGWRDLQLR